MAMEALTLIANPGSASRKYALFDGKEGEILSLHFEHDGQRVLCTLQQNGQRRELPLELGNLDESARHVPDLLAANNLLPEGAHIGRVGLRVVAPSSFFMQDHIVDDDFVSRLETLLPRAPLHINATLTELYILREVFSGAQIVGISDSGFHAGKPDYAWNYGLPLHDTDRFEIKRYGYHGLSVASAVHCLHTFGKLPRKVVVCHLGSGASVTAVHAGKSIDNSMGYSPLEGVIMATRSGNVDPTAVQALQSALGFNDQQMDEYLNTQSGLLGLSGSSADIRELLERESQGDHHAELALQTYIYSVQKAVGQMTAVLGGVDMLVFTGTVGERSAPIRERIAKPLHYLDLFLDSRENEDCSVMDEPVCVSKLTKSKPIYVVPADEAAQMSRHIKEL